MPLSQLQLPRVHPLFQQLLLLCLHLSLLLALFSSLSLLILLFPNPMFNWSNLDLSPLQFYPTLPLLLESPLLFPLTKLSLRSFRIKQAKASLHLCLLNQWLYRLILDAVSKNRQTSEGIVWHASARSRSLVDLGHSQGPLIGVFHVGRSFVTRESVSSPFMVILVPNVYSNSSKVNIFRAQNTIRLGRLLPPWSWLILKYSHSTDFFHPSCSFTFLSVL